MGGDKDFIVLTNSDKRESEVVREDFEINRVDIREQNRKDLHFKITHILAIIIIMSFTFDILMQTILRPDNINIPDYFISIVSVVIGFYFARSLPFK
jgi:hypothetical protein